MKNLRCTTAALALAALVLAGCSSGGSSGGSGGQGGSGQGSATTAGATADRPSSTAKLTIDAPRNGQIVSGSNLTLELELKGAQIVPATTTKIRPDQGHVHVMLDGKLISMNYKLSEKLPKLSPRHAPHPGRVRGFRPPAVRSESAHAGGVPGEQVSP